MALQKATDSLVQERTVSVRPSRNSRVIDASYVKQKRPASCRERTEFRTSAQENRYNKYTLIQRHGRVG